MSELNRQKPLTQLNIFIENNRSLTCRYGLSCHHESTCTQAGKNGNGHNHLLSLDCIGKAIDQAISLGLQKVQISGGEPFLYPKIDELLDQLESHELGVTIETSGSGLTATRAAYLARLPQARVTIGLDGAGPFTHDGLHDVPGAFEIATNAIRLLVNAGLAPHIFFTVSRQNHAQLGATIHLVELLGGETIHFVSATPKPPTAAQPHKNGSLPPKDGVDKTDGVDILSMEEWIALGRKVERELSKTTRLRLSVDLPPVFRGLHPQARVEGQGRCPVLNSLALLSTGEYALCGGAETIPALVFGHVESDSLEQIWNMHPALVSIREALPSHLEGICGRCIMKNACLGYCAAENYLSAGTFEGPNLFCKSAESIGLFPAGRLIENLLW